MDIISTLKNAVLLNETDNTLENSKTKSQIKAKQVDEHCIYTNHNVDSDLLKISIEELNIKDSSVNNLEIDKLKKIATPAKFGHKEKTVFNKKIRNTLAIPNSLIELQFNNTKWQKLLNENRGTLRLGPNVEVTAHLHNLLIYEPGGLFKEHQDGEKLPGMFGTLVLILPIPHIGGNLCFDHKHALTVMRSENIFKAEIQAVAFYADQVHSVQPVIDGHRVVLTFNLVSKSQSLVANPDNSYPEINSALADYFKFDKRTDPKYLVIPLEHHYSQIGLANNIFKGRDEHYLQQLLNSAAELSLLINIVQLEYFESIDDYDEDSILDKSYEITFSYPFGNQDISSRFLERTSLPIPKDNVFPLSTLRKNLPDQYEKIEWMGNEGSTKDYWYHHTAVFIYQEKDKWYWAFKLSKENAIINLVNYLHTLENREDAKKLLMEQIDFILPNFTDIFILERFKIINYFADKAIAKQIFNDVNYFHLSTLHFSFIEQSIEVFSHEFISDLLTPKKTNYQISNTDRIPDLINDLIKHNSSLTSDILTALSAYMKNYDIKMLISKHSLYFLIRDMTTELDDDKYYNELKRNRGIDKFQIEMTPIIKALLIGAYKTNMPHLIDSAIDSFNNEPLLYPPRFNATLFKDILIHEDTILSNKTLADFFKQQTQLLSLELETLKQELGSYKIPVLLNCNCEYCQDTDEFLNSPTYLNYIIEAIQKTRKHVERNVKHITKLCKMETKKTGSPHKLIIRKVPDLILKQQQKDIKSLEQLIKFLNSVNPKS